MVGRFLRKLCAIVMVVCFSNFLLFLAGTFYLGGDAVNGKVDGGRYYLWGVHGGTKGYTEVSQAVFNYSRWHVYTLMVTWPLMILAALACERIGRRGED
jgi:hypothetical protein